MLPFIMRSIRVTVGMSAMDFSPQYKGQARQYYLDMKKRGKMPQLDTIVRIVIKKNRNGSLKLSPEMTEKQFQEKIKNLRKGGCKA